MSATTFQDRRAATIENDTLPGNALAGKRPHRGNFSQKDGSTRPGILRRSIGPSPGPSMFRWASISRKKSHSVQGFCDSLLGIRSRLWHRYAPAKGRGIRLAHDARSIEGFTDLRILSENKASSEYTTHMGDPQREDLFFSHLCRRSLETEYWAIMKNLRFCSGIDPLASIVARELSKNQSSLFRVQLLHTHAGNLVQIVDRLEGPVLLPVTDDCLCFRGRQP